MCFPVNFAKFLSTPFQMGHLRWLLLPIITYKKRNNKFSKVTIVILLSMESCFPDTSNCRLKNAVCSR